MHSRHDGDIRSRANRLETDAFSYTSCSAYQRQTPPRRLCTGIRVHEALRGREDPDYPARAIRTRCPIISPKSLVLSPEKTVDRILSGILIMNWRIARWWGVAARLAGRVSDPEKLIRREASSESPSDRTIQSTWLASRRKSEGYSTPAETHRSFKLGSHHACTPTPRSPG